MGVYILSTEETLYYYNNYYANGVSTVQLAKMFGHTHHYYLDRFKECGLEIRNNKINSRRYYVNSSYFENIDSQEKAYWLGYIYADGYISKTKAGNIFGMSLGEKDKDQLLKFKECLKATYPIRTYTTNSYKDGTKYVRLNIRDEKLVNDLEKWGVIPHKTNVLKPPQINATYNASFILGYFDGDGSIFLNKTKSPFYSISIVGTDPMLEYIHSYLKSVGAITKEIKLEKRKPEHVVSYIRYGGNRMVTNIMSKLYENIDLSLPLNRKYSLYLKCKNRIF